MKTLHTSLRVADLARSLRFYEAVGFEEIGRVSPSQGTTLVMLNLPGDGDVVTLELAAESETRLERGNGLSAIAIQVDDLAATLRDFATRGIEVEPIQHPGGPDGPQTSFIEDPDGYRFELVQWPAGHAREMTRADWR